MPADMDDGPRSDSDTKRRGHVESTAAVIERGRESLLAALGKAYSVVVLASLSLVVAAFARNFSPNAVSYAVAASASFLAAVASPSFTRCVDLRGLPSISRSVRRPSSPSSQAL